MSRYVSKNASFVSKSVVSNEFLWGNPPTTRREKVGYNAPRNIDSVGDDIMNNDDFELEIDNVGVYTVTKQDPKKLTKLVIEECYRYLKCYSEKNIADLLKKLQIAWTKSNEDEELLHKYFKESDLIRILGGYKFKIISSVSISDCGGSCFQFMDYVPGKEYSPIMVTKEDVKDFIEIMKSVQVLWSRKNIDNEVQETFNLEYVLGDTDHYLNTICEQVIIQTAKKLGIET